MSVPSNLRPFWNEFAESVGGVDEERFYEACYFGDNEEMANELCELTINGKKCATATSLWSLEDEGKQLPNPGDFSIIIDWSGSPKCIIETLRVEITAFKDVDEEFAEAEGEGDGSLDFWREAHRDFFTRECRKSSRGFSEDILIACERFKVVYKKEG